MPGVPGRHKVRMVCKGFMESANEYGTVWAPVMRHETCRMFFCRAAYKRLKMRSIDVCSAFLTAPLKRPVYMRAPKGHEREGYVCAVRRACYGLCDAPRAFYTDFRDFLKSKSIVASAMDPCLYQSRNPAYSSVWILQYVDDLQIQGTDKNIAAHSRSGRLPLHVSSCRIGPIANPNINDSRTCILEGHIAHGANCFQ